MWIIVEILLKLDPRFQVTENVLKHVVKSSNVKTLELLLPRDPQIKITQRMMERAAKREGVEILKLFVGHMPDKERLNVPERLLGRAANNLEVLTFVLEQWPSIQSTSNVFECAVEEFDKQVLDLFLEKFEDFRFSTHFLVVAAKHTIGESFRAILECAQEQSVLPTDEVLQAAIARSSAPGPPGPPLPPSPGGPGGTPKPGYGQVGAGRK
jgi:hypothetical protein